jgi:hypothetical protein
MPAVERTLKPDEQSMLLALLQASTPSDDGIQPRSLFGMWTRSPHRVVEVIRTKPHTGGVGKMPLVSSVGIALDTPLCVMSAACSCLHLSFQTPKLPSLPGRGLHGEG